MADPYIDDVVLLLHCNGTDGSTTFDDSSSVGHTVGVTGNAQIDTAQSKWGGASGLFDGAGDSINITDNANKDGFSWPSALAFTVEFWVRFNSIGTQQYLITFGTTSSYHLSIYMNSIGKIIFYMRGVRGTSTTTMATGQWYHIKVSRSTSGNAQMAINGTHEGGTYGLNIGNTANDNYPLIGLRHDGAYPLDGWIDDLRVTKGINRYTSDFTPPTEEFPNPGYDARIAAATPLGAPALLAISAKTVFVDAATPLGAPAVLTDAVDVVRINAKSPLGAPYTYFYNDFTDLLSGVESEIYVMDLTVSGEPVRVKIKSWQGTLQTTDANYVQCVIPAITSELATSINAATEFTVSRQAEIDGVTVEQVMVQAPITKRTYSRGSINYTCVLNGTTDGYATYETPPAIYDRELEGIRSSTVSDSGVRYRCKIDWLLKPGHTAYVDGVPFVVGYINYFALGSDVYMDAGYRN